MARQLQTVLAPVTRDQPTSMSKRHLASRGFTLVELMIVVAMVGVLATLALVGYRKYIASAKVSEATQMCQAIRGAQEQYRAETTQYLNVSSSNTFYPHTAYDGKKHSWVMQGHADYVRWRALGVVSDGPVRFGYRANSGLAGTAVSVPVDFTPAPTFPAAPNEPWYVIQARGDPGEKTKPTSDYPVKVFTSSFSGEVSVSED